MRRQRRQLWRRARWLAPGAGVTAHDHPVDETGDDTRTGHDFEMTADNDIEAKRCGIERHKAEIAGEIDHAAAARVGQCVPDVKRLGDVYHALLRPCSKAHYE